MTGILMLGALLAVIVGPLWVLDRYIRSRGGEEWHW